MPTKPLVDLQTGVAERHIYSSEEVYKQELENVFGRCWLYVAHESQIPKANDFFANYMAEDPVLVARDAKGKLHTFLNMCRHRGNRICRADAGNAPSFMCTYHGWTFATDGKLVGVPGYKEAYFEELDRSQWGLVEAQTDSYKGMIFATWDKNAPTLRDFLGDAAWYMDIWLDRVSGGTELVGGTHRWDMNFNWKFGADNFGGDGYHTTVSHGSMSVYGERQTSYTARDPARFNVSMGNGHCVLAIYAGNNIASQTSRAAGTSVTNEYMMSIRQEMEQRLGKERAKMTSIGVGNIFPNLTWHGSPLVRNWHPRGPEKTEIWSWAIVDKKAPQEVKDAMRFNCTQKFGPSGNMEQDDANNWFNSTALAKSRTAKAYPLNMQMGMGHEFNVETHPGVSFNRTPSEANWRHFYGFWSQMMEAPSWFAVKLDPITSAGKG